MLFPHLQAAPVPNMLNIEIYGSTSSNPTATERKLSIKANICLISHKNK
jgi:hypothetical protein